MWLDGFAIDTLSMQVLRPAQLLLITMLVQCMYMYCMSTGNHAIAKHAASLEKIFRVY